MATFILIHGGMHGGWCWEKVVPLLRDAGHDALAPTLPGMAPDEEVPPGQVTLARYADYVAGIVSGQGEPVVLVGHSMGGITISETAERVPERLLGLVYVSAELVPSGRSMFDLRADYTASTGVATVSADGLTLNTIPQMAAEVFRLAPPSPRRLNTCQSLPKVRHSQPSDSGSWCRWVSSAPLTALPGPREPASVLAIVNQLVGR